MRKLNLFICILVLLGLISACDIIEKDGGEPEPELQEIGFLGTMPNDSIKISGKLVTATNSEVSMASSGNGTVVSRILNLNESNSQTTLELQLPFIKTDNEVVTFGEGSQVATKLKEYVNQKYTFDILKNVLSKGDKNINPSDDLTQSFRLGIVFQKYYKAFYTNGNQTGSIFKVKELIEGSENDPNLGTLKTLEVVFDVDVKMYSFDIPNPSQNVGNMKGLLRMKFKEKK
jgi:hypothetical protein